MVEALDWRSRALLAESEEERLRTEVERLRALLRAHGIDPDAACPFCELQHPVGMCLETPDFPCPT
jgi:hypothetical protein